jgi:hypothetical protein
MTASVSVDVCDGVLRRVHHGDRELQRQVLLIPVLITRGLDRHRNRGVPDALVAVQQHPRLGQGVKDAGQEGSGDVAMHEQRLKHVADPGSLQLRVEDDGLRGVKVGAGIDVHMTVPRGRVDHRDGGHSLEGRLETLPAPGNDQIDHPGLRRELGELLAPTAGDERQRPIGQTRLGGSSGGDAGQHGVRVRSGTRSAQHDRVPGLETQRGGVDGDIRSRFVDDGDDAERDSDLAHVETVGESGSVDHFTDRVGQGGDASHSVGHRRDPCRVKREPVHQRLGQSSLPACRQIPPVGLEDLRGALQQRPRDRLEGGVLGP